MKARTPHGGLAGMLMTLAAWMVAATGAAHAQTIVVNGAACATATVQFTQAGYVAVLPAGCSGNGNPCDSAVVTFSLAGISIQAPPACLTAGPIASPMALQSVIVNGTTCNGATVTHSANGMAINAPSTCLVGPTPAPVKLLSAKSRKTHGAAGTFDVAIEPTAAMDGNITVEPRAIGAGHLIVFEFDGAITSAGTASAVDSMGAAVSVNVPASPPGNLIFVTLPAVSDGRRVTISLAGINGVSSAHASIGFLLGDVNNSRVVNAADLATVKANSGQVCNAANFKNDLKASGRINVADIAGVKARLGATLAP